MKTNRHKSGGIDFVGDKVQKTLKTAFNFFISVKIFYTPPAYITQNTSAKNVFSITPKLTEKLVRQLSPLNQRDTFFIGALC